MKQLLKIPRSKYVECVGTARAADFLGVSLSKLNLMVKSGEVSCLGIYKGKRIFNLKDIRLRHQLLLIDSDYLTPYEKYDWLAKS